MRKNLEIVSLIYKSKPYLDSIVSEMGSSLSVDGWNIKFRVVANDASNDILTALEKKGVPFSVYVDPQPEDYYLNRVYRCWNHAAQTCKEENICFVNSDMIFSKDWLKNLLAHHDGVNIPTSRLIESGKMPSGQHGVSFNCGQTLKTFNKKTFESVCEAILEERAESGGLFMPCVFEVERFLNEGGFPEGNIYADGVGTCGVFVESGDNWFFRKLERNLV